MKYDCPFCGIEKGEKFMINCFAPTASWFEVSRRGNGLMQMKFGYGDDDNDALIFVPKYCPECGKKIEVESADAK